LRKEGKVVEGKVCEGAEKLLNVDELA